MDASDPFLMIGLHKLAAERGDGFVPELFSLLLERSRRDLQAALPDRLDLAPQACENEATGNDNVVAFPGRQKHLRGR